jgi:hypothetical protein
MTYFLAPLVGTLAVAVMTRAFHIGRSLDRSEAMRAGTARMPQGATHENA